MADAVVTIPTTQNIDTTEITRSDGTVVERQRINIADPVATSYFAGVSYFGELSVTGQQNSLLRELIAHTKRIARGIEILIDAEITIADAD